MGASGFGSGSGGGGDLGAVGALTCVGAGRRAGCAFVGSGGVGVVSIRRGGATEIGTDAVFAGGRGAELAAGWDGAAPAANVAAGSVSILATVAPGAAAGLGAGAMFTGGRAFGVAAASDRGGGAVSARSSSRSSGGAKTGIEVILAPLRRARAASRIA